MKFLLPLLSISMTCSLIAQDQVSIQHDGLRPINPLYKGAAVTDAGLWPLLQKLENDELYAIGFNQPAHGKVPGDVDGWGSTDGGESWQFVGRVAERPNDSSNRMNTAFGQYKDGLIAITSGYRKGSGADWQLIEPVITRSTDKGRTWTEEGAFLCGLSPIERVIPFGPIVRGSDGTLRFCVYNRPSPEILTSAYMVASEDEGKTWKVVSEIAPITNETVIFEVADKEWIAIARVAKEPRTKGGEPMRQLRSTDNGETWVDEGLLTSELGHPASIIRLNDGRLLLTYSDRARNRILAHISSDKGRDWGAPLQLFRDMVGDGGYPSTVQLSNGNLVTLFYSKRSALIDIHKVQYHTGVLLWQLP